MESGYAGDSDPEFASIAGPDLFVQSGLQNGPADEEKDATAPPEGKRRKVQFRFDKDGGHDLPLGHAIHKARVWDVGQKGAKYKTVPAAWEAVVAIAEKLPLPKRKVGRI